MESVVVVGSVVVAAFWPQDKSNIMDTPVRVWRKIEIVSFMFNDFRFDLAYRLLIINCFFDLRPMGYSIVPWERLLGFPDLLHRRVS